MRGNHSKIRKNELEKKFERDFYHLFNPTINHHFNLIVSNI